MLVLQPPTDALHAAVRNQVGGHLLVVSHPIARYEAHLLIPVALAHLAAIDVEDHWQMRIHRPRIAQRLLQGDVINGIEQMLLPAQDVRYAHFRVIDDHAEVIRRHAVALADDKVLHLARPDALIGSQHSYAL